VRLRTHDSRLKPSAKFAKIEKTKFRNFSKMVRFALDELTALAQQHDMGYGHP